MHCILIGNYGVGNLGDEALRQYFVGAFPEVEWQVVSAHPAKGELHRLPGGLRSIFKPWWKTLKAIKQADAVVFGGGTLFTDVESVYACVLWWMHAKAAFFYGKPLHLAFQGVGPFRSSGGEALARKIYEKAASISVRDTSSYERVKSWGLGTEVVQTFDPVFCLLQKENKAKNTKNVFIIIPRRNSQKTTLSRAQEILSHNSFDAVSILLLQPDDEGERHAADALRTQLSIPATISAVGTIDELRDGVGDGSMVLTERFHGAVAALATGVPFATVSQGVGDKLDALPRNVTAADIEASVKKGESALRMALVRHEGAR